MIFFLLGPAVSGDSLFVKQTRSWCLLAGVGLCAAIFSGCPAEGVGDPCVPEDEYSPTFSGFALTEVNTESRSFQCQSRLCLVNHLQGRVSCPYGQKEGGTQCKVPGTNEPVSVPIEPQRLDRRDDDAVYCSCRCDGPDPNARYCECPNGFSCAKVVPQLVSGRVQLPGSYCVRSGSEYVETEVGEATCDREKANCGPE